MADSLGWRDSGQGWRAPRRISLNEFAKAGELGRDPSIQCGLEVTEAYQALYSEAFRFTPMHPLQVALVDPSKAGDHFLEFCAGSFPTEGPLDYVAPFFDRAFSPRRFDNSPASYLEIVAKRLPTPLSTGCHTIEANHFSWGDLTIFVFDPNDGQDVIDFWNTRTFQRDVIPAHVDWLASCNDFLRDVIEKTYRRIPGNPYGTKFQARVEFARSIGRAKAQEFGRAHFDGLQPGSLTIKLWCSPIWERFESNQGPQYRRAILDAGRKELDVEYGDSRNYGSFESLSPSFAPSFGSRPQYANVLRFQELIRSPPFAHIYPNNVFDASFPEMARGDWVLTTREGWVFPLSGERHILFTTFDPEVAMVKWLERQSITARATVVSRIARNIVDSVGDIHGARLLADAETIRLLEAMASTIVEHVSSDGLRRTERRYPDKARPAWEWNTLVKKRQKKLWQSWVSVERFIEARVLRLGLDVPCPHCTNSTWFALDALSYQLLCDHCLKEFPYPQARPAWKNQWQFRVIGPFATPNYAQGAYSTILTLHALRSLDMGNAAMSWATGLLLPDNREIDLALWYRREGASANGEEPQFVVGEAKSFGEGDILKDKDIATLRWVAERVPGAFMAVSVMKDTLTDAERSRLTELARWGRSERINGRPKHPLMVLTGLELFAERNVRSAWKDAGGVVASLSAHPSTRVDDLMTFAEITQQAYLGLKPFHEDLET
jgi:hypothetical protein